MNRLGTIGAIGAIVLVLSALFFLMTRKTMRGLTPIQAAKVLDEFIAGTGGDYDFDYFISVQHSDPEVERARLRCVAIEDEFPPVDGRGYCSPEGMREIAQLAEQLRKHSGGR